MEYISRAFRDSQQSADSRHHLVDSLLSARLVLLGGTYNGFMLRRRNNQCFNHLIKDLTPDGIENLKESLPQKTDSLYVRYLKDMLDNGKDHEDYTDYLITQYETETVKEVNLSRLLAKLGPVLGLIGTLISMSPALVGLSTGDISGMAYNMQVVFAATVVGLVISAVGLFTLQLKQRWFAQDVNNLDYVARILNLKEEHP
nr:MotA/TolQ/ExbB proton channel family protein [Segatella maculosa]